MTSIEEKPIVHEWYRRYNIKLRSADFGNAVFDADTNTCVIFQKGYVYLKDLAKTDEFWVLAVNEGDRPGAMIQRKIEEISGNRILIKKG